MNAAALRETLRFVEPNLAGARRVLDVGAGRGELVRALRGRGYDAIGVDKEEGTDFLDFAGGPFDALLFVASLHHMPLAQTMEHAHRLLAPGGVLIADEFDVDAPDEATARYWLELKDREGDALREWRHHHAHHGVLASGRAMREAIAARFKLREERTAPYLYRYLPDEVDDDRVFLEETRLIAEGSLRPVGLRLLASR
jgi:SAM-dependent methyltransferase